MRDSFTYNRPETGEQEKVFPWQWCWEAFYADGTIFKQFNPEDGSFHQIREIDTPNLHFMRLVNYNTGRFFDVLWHPARKLICGVLRNILDNGQRRVDIYYLGYATQVEGTNHNVILAVLPDGNIIVTEDLGKIQVL